MIHPNPVLHAQQRDLVATVVEDALLTLNAPNGSATVRRVTDADFIVTFTGVDGGPESAVRVTVRKS